MLLQTIQRGEKVSCARLYAMLLERQPTVFRINYMAMCSQKEKIKQYASAYRAAICSAHQDGRFVNDIPFRSFPQGCCGNTCYLLAEHLRQVGLNTIWYSTERRDWSHAWLVVKDERVKEPTTKTYSWPKELISDLKRYGAECPEDGITDTRYEASDLANGLIIDITGDQFGDYEEAVFVGEADQFHKSFEFIQAHDIGPLNDRRLCSLYGIIEEYL